MWVTAGKKGVELLGYLPEIFRDDDNRDLISQANDRYAHGGGWRKFTGFEFDDKTGNIQYPGDPVYKPVAFGYFGKEMLIVYPHAWVCIVKEDGSREIARMD